MQANILVYDVGSTYTKAAAFRLEGERLEFLGRDIRAIRKERR